jgi:hypothetical protein
MPSISDLLSLDRLSTSKQRPAKRNPDKKYLNVPISNQSVKPPSFHFPRVSATYLFHNPETYRQIMSSISEPAGSADPSLPESFVENRGSRENPVKNDNNDVRNRQSRSTKKRRIGPRDLASMCMRRLVTHMKLLEPDALCVLPDSYLWQLWHRDVKEVFFWLKVQISCSDMRLSCHSRHGLTACSGIWQARQILLG